MTTLFAIALLAIFGITTLIYLKKGSENRSSSNKLGKVLSEIESVKSTSELDEKLSSIYIDSKASVMILESIKDVKEKSIKRALLERALENKSDDILNILKTKYKEFDTDSKFTILEYLSVYGSSESMTIYIDFLVRDHMIFTRLPLDKLDKNPRYADIVFPKLMNLGLPEDKRYQVYSVINTYLANKLLFSDKIASIKENVLMQYRNIAYDFERYNDRGRLYWRYDVPMYMETRTKMLILIELLGSIYEEEVLIELKRAIKFNDPLINAYALVAIVKLGESIDDYVITLQELCEYPEVRKYLYFELESMNMKMKFPYEFRSQKYLAQSEIFNLFISQSKIYAEPMNIKFYSKIDISDKYSMYTFICDIKYSKEEELHSVIAYSGPFLNEKIESSGHGLTYIHYQEVNEKELTNELVHDIMRDKINNWLLKL